MPRFAYQVRDGSGKTDSGVLTAADASEASRILRKDGKAVVALREDVIADPMQAAMSRNKKINRDDVIFFATQLAVMVDTGVPLADALDAIGDQAENPGMKAVVQDVSQQVKAGVEFSAALEKYPKVFSKLFAAMMKASEASGTMGSMLQRVSEYMEQERDTRKRIKGAMTYPVCMLSFCILVVVALLVFVLPRFENIYAGKGATLPLPTRMLLGISSGILSYWPVILVVLAGAGVGGYLYLRRPEGKIFMDRLRINMPVMGGMYRKAYLSRSLRTMATMISAGVSMLEGLAITAQVAGNHFYAKVWTGLAERVREGAAMTDELMKCRLIPRTVTQMIGAGERTGKLATVMNRVAVFCEDDLRVAVKTMTQMIEPIMIIVMGLLIGGIAIALLLPILSVSKVMAH
jgi:type IV pilus assembly protein PilC